MKRTILRHIKELQAIAKALEAKLKKEADPRKRQALEERLRVARSVVTHYRLALRIEGLT